MVYKEFFMYLTTWIAGAGGSPTVQIRILRFGEVKILLPIKKRVVGTFTNISFQVTVKKPSSHMWYFLTILF